MSGIVIIEQDSLMRGLLVEWLTAEGYAVRTCEASPSAAEGPPDLVVVDVYMPRQDGPNRLHSIQSEFPGTPVIAISGQFRPGLAGGGTTAQALGARQVIAKPFSRSELLTAVRAVVGPA